MTPIINEYCEICKHFTGFKKKNGITQMCKAFPDGIPKEIILNNILHDQKMYNQKNDIIFEVIANS